MSRQIEIKMPDPGAFSCSTSGNGEYQEARSKAILSQIPEGYVLVDSDIKSFPRTLWFAVITVEESQWKGIPAKDRTLWFGIAKEGMKAPWLSGGGACFVKIWDIRRTADGTVEYGIGNENKPEPESLLWVRAQNFYSEWPK